MKVAEATQVIMEHISMFQVTDLEEGISLRHPHDHAVQDLLFTDKTELDKVVDREVGELIIAHSPDQVTLETEKFHNQERFVRWGHGGTPVLRLMDPAEGDLLLGNIDPGLVSDALPVHHDRHDYQVPEFKACGGFENLSWWRGPEHADERGNGNAGYELIGRKRPHLALMINRDALNPEIGVINADHSGFGEDVVVSNDLIPAGRTDARCRG